MVLGTPPSTNPFAGNPSCRLSLSRYAICMGVPAFYRWLSEKYAKTVVDVIEESPPYMDEGEPDYTAIDISAPNPNDLEFDNLYIDMNGIIHPCAHPESGEAPKTEQEMYIRVMKYIDRLVAAIRPRRLLYLAIDGTAPRAKMNQQRARRFRAAQEEEQRRETEEEAREYMKALGHALPTRNKAWDSNVITPGTTFMCRLAKYLRFYIRDRLNNVPGWRNLKVILSDAGVPGEGEHKIMSFIRNQRTDPKFDCNQKHILHGLDADLIMLGLATHEPNFTILREQVLFGKQKAEKVEKKAETKRKRGEFGEHDGDVAAVTPLQFLHIHTLREYLQVEFQDLKSTIPFEYDFDRIVDDFVFLCFFVGNDFLPHLPSLDIRDGALDFLIILYKRLLPALGGYLTNAGEVFLSRVDVILAEIGKVEDEIFRRMKDKEEREKQRRQQYNQRQQNRGHDAIAAAAAYDDAVAVTRRKIDHGRSDTDNANAAAALRQQRTETLVSTPSIEQSKYAGMPVEEAIKKKIKDEEEKKLSQYRENLNDVVRLGEEGWRQRYYADKYKSDDIAHGGGREKVFHSYVEGLCWVMAYYYRGCVSWKWFYPFHYAPFASDLVNIDRFKIEFTKEVPFCPVEQLMGVLPAASKHAIPKPLHWLMEDPESPIIDFYPKEVPVDPNGKAMPWLWVVLLPFIDEERLLAAMKPYVDQFTAKEKLRNERFGNEYLFFHVSSKMGTSYPTKTNASEAMEIDLETSDSLAGKMVFSNNEDIPIGSVVVAPKKPSGALQNITNNQVIGVEILPIEEKPHLCRFLEGVVVPAPVLTEADHAIRTPRLSRHSISIVDLAGGAPANRMICNNLGVNYNQYLQGGTRQWGSLEPQQKRRPAPANAFSTQQSANHFTQRAYNSEHYPSRGGHYPSRGGNARSAGGAAPGAYSSNRGGYSQGRGRNSYPNRNQGHYPRDRSVPPHSFKSYPPQQNHRMEQPGRGNYYHGHSRGEPIATPFVAPNSRFNMTPSSAPTLESLRAGLMSMHQQRDPQKYSSNTQQGSHDIKKFRYS